DRRQDEQAKRGGEDVEGAFDEAIETQIWLVDFRFHGFYGFSSHECLPDAAMILPKLKVEDGYDRGCSEFRKSLTQITRKGEWREYFF
ncbi:MAG: hypothetical protein HZB37_07745, partial [Planctomycetes bacterium]|nr:hypothetical protein [Planctomycetota bacterium]